MHVNLIYLDEQRSASPVSFGLIVRLGIVVILVLGAVAGVSFYSACRTLDGNVRAADEEWKRTEPRYRAMLQLRTDLDEAEKASKEVMAWRDSRIAWGDQFDQFQAIVPSVIQLKELRISQTILSISNNLSARAFELRISGKTVAARSEVNVAQFLDGFKQPALQPFVDAATLPAGAFRQDPEVKSDRIFEIVCKYRPRLIE